MKTFYRGFTIKTTDVKGEYGHFVMWSIYVRKGLVRDDNRPLLKARGKTYKGEVREAQKHIDALLSGCRVKKFRRCVDEIQTDRRRGELRLSDWVLVGGAPRMRRRRRKRAHTDRQQGQARLYQWCV